MSLGRSQARFALSYVDELLANFAVHPQKSIQNVFQRILVSCGGDTECVAWHVAKSLLMAIGAEGKPGPSAISESHAINLITLILKFATEEQPGRSEKEVNGAESLFTALAERAADYLSTMAQNVSPDEGSACLDFINKMLSLAENNQQTAFLASLVGADISTFVEGFIEDFLKQFISDHTRIVRCSLRTDYVTRILHYALECNIPNLCNRSVIKMINMILADPDRPQIEKRCLQPLLFAFIGKQEGTVNLTNYDRLMQQAGDIVTAGAYSLSIVQGAREANRINALAIALISDGNQYTVTTQIFQEFLYRLSEVIFVFPGSVAAAIVATTNSDARMGAMRGHPHDGKLPWNPFVMATVFNTAYELNWVEVFNSIKDNISFRIPSRASFQFFYEILNAGFQRGFPMDLMYKIWPYVDGQIDFFERVLEYIGCVWLDNYAHTPVDLSMLKIPEERKNSGLFRQWKCLELLTLFIHIVEAHPTTLGRINALVSDFLDESPDIILMELMQIKAPVTDFRMNLMKTALMELIAGHPNGPVAISHVLKNSVGDEELFAALNPPQLLINACIEIHQFFRVTCSPKKIATMIEIYKTLHSISEEVAKNLLKCEEISCGFDFAILAEAGGLCTVEAWLAMREEIDEEDLFRFLAENAWKKSPCCSIDIGTRLIEFSSANKATFRRLGLSSTPSTTSASSKSSSTHSTPVKSSSSPKESYQEDIATTSSTADVVVDEAVISVEEPPAPMPEKQPEPKKKAPIPPKLPPPKDLKRKIPKALATPPPAKVPPPLEAPKVEPKVEKKVEEKPKPSEPLLVPPIASTSEVVAASAPPNSQEEPSTSRKPSTSTSQEQQLPKEPQQFAQPKPKQAPQQVSKPEPKPRDSPQQVIKTEPKPREVPQQVPQPRVPSSVPSQSSSQEEPKTKKKEETPKTFQPPPGIPHPSTSSSSPQAAQKNVRFPPGHLFGIHPSTSMDMQPLPMHPPPPHLQQQQMRPPMPPHSHHHHMAPPPQMMPQMSMPPPPVHPPSLMPYDLQQQLAMKESGRSASVSSTGRAPLNNSFPPSVAADPRMQRQQPFPNSVAAPYNPLNNYMQQQPQAQSTGNPGGLNNMFGANSFGGSQELIRGAAPSNVSFSANSPTSQPRSVGMPQPPQRQNSSSSCWSLPGAAPSSRPPGPPTPSQQLNFGAQLPATGAQIDFQARANPQQQQVIDADLSQMAFPEDVQEEANSYFEQIYTPNPGAMALTVPVLIEKLKGFKNSGNARDQKILACVVKNLFEEYKFFNEYPLRELEITAELYGGIIREGIISNLHFATAVRKVIESLSQQPTSNLFKFGLVSLEHCRIKLCAYPKVCSMIYSLETFKNFPTNIQEFVRAGMSGELPQNVAAGRSTPPIWNQAVAARSGSADSNGRNASTSSATGPGRTVSNALSYTNSETLIKATESDGAEVPKPSEPIADKISFLFNNLSQSNMAAKKDEVLTLINEQGEDFIRWLAQYIVMKRVSIEQNFQPLYNTFVQLLDHPLLDVHIKKETFRNIRILLRADKRQAVSNFGDRQLLKNLGMWLGAITIARSKPILINELDLKSLLMEAYYKGQQELLFVVPFVAKILLSCSKTPIFTASCAWIRSILKILAELHNEPDLKINLKFEIEVLCKELNVDLNSLPMEGVLKDTDRLLRVQQQLSELKLLARPDVLPNSSPNPNQMRVAGDNVPTPGNDTKPSTPNPEGEGAANGSVEPVPQSNFGYHDINVISYEGLTPHLQIRQNLPLFQMHPQLKHMVRHALTIAIKELIGPVSERAQKIAMTVTENLIRKDFALDPDERNVKQAAFHMMRAMTAGMAMITCRDPLGATMMNALQNSFSQALRHSAQTAENTKMVEEAATVITNENVELATNFIVKTACEKAASEMEKRLESDFQRRIVAKQNGVQWTDEEAERNQAKLPARIAIQAGPTKKELLDIYNQFGAKICGFKSTAVEEPVIDNMPIQLNEEEQKTTAHLQGQLTLIIREVDTTMGAQPNNNNSAYKAVGVIREMLVQLAQNPRDSRAIGDILSKSVEHLLHAFHVDPNTKSLLDVEWPRRLRDLFIGVTRICLNLTTIQEIARRITSTIVGLNVDYKWNVEAIEVLYKHNLLQTSVFDKHLATKISSGPQVDQATFFAQKLFRSLTQGENKANQFTVLKETFSATYEQLLKVAQLQQANNRVPAPGEAANVNSPLFFEPEGNGENELSTKVVEGVLREWISLCYQPVAQRNPQDALATMIHVMHDHGCLATDEKVSCFFKMCTEMCVDVTVRMVKGDPHNSAHNSTVIRQRCYYTLDAYVKLIALMIKFSDGNQAQTKITLLKKVLSIIAQVLTLDHDCRPKDFNAMPYHRILITLFNELTTPDGTTLDSIQWNVLEAFGQALFLLQPRRCPMFVYAWLDIVGHRNVIGKLLGGAPDNQESIKMSAMYTQLIICHLKFMSPFLRNIHMPKSIGVLYKGTLRVLLVILHDFPELLCEFHYVICDTIPANCVQLRNLVLSAYPRNMRLPDPFALNFKQVDSIQDMAQEPKSNLNMTTIIPAEIRVQLDEYLKNRENVAFLTALPGLLQMSQTAGSKYNTTVLNAVVLYVGIKAIENLHLKRTAINIHTIAHTPYMDVFQNLAVQLCTEGRYLLFNAIANQLRYPNAHTHYFSCVFLFLFLNSDCDAIQEQITRILFERLVALRPHPWGLLITFIELIKNPVYNFWKFEFTRCAPEIERLFQNVANTCVPASRPSADPGRS